MLRLADFVCPPECGTKDCDVCFVTTVIGLNDRCLGWIYTVVNLCSDLDGSCSLVTYQHCQYGRILEQRDTADTKRM